MYSKPTIVSFPTQTDLTGSPWCAVKFDGTDGDLAVCGAGERPCGVLQAVGSIPTISAGDKRQVGLQVGGLVKLELAATLAANAEIALDANGKGVAAGAGDYVIGYLPLSASSGDIALVQWDSYQKN